VCAICAECALLYAWVSVGYRYSENKTLNLTPRVCVIVPCKGTGKNFRENVIAITQQQYTNYHVVFIVDSAQDSAYQQLQDLFEATPHVSFLIAEMYEGCSGKIAALLTGIHHAGEVDVYVFADSDIKPHDQWLPYLLAGLTAKDVGATTGYRWYFPHDLKSLLISSWNMILSISLFYKSYNYAWGGSMAITRELFTKLQIETAWKTGFSDDLILTKRVRNAGYTIQFIPQCISESPVDGTLKQLITWGSRQVTWVRWYYPSIWMISVIGAVGLKIVTLLGIVALIFGLTLPGVLMISTILFEIIIGGVAHSTLMKVMRYPKKQFSSSIAYAVVAPLVFFIVAYNNFISIFKKKITWGGRIYKKPKKSF
jgi:ceramide glucosyltransferase